MAKTSIDMTSGEPWKLLLRFAIPTMLGGLLNQVYSITDSIIVGRYLGESALAAVGSCGPVVMLLGAILVGLNMGVAGSAWATALAQAGAALFSFFMLYRKYPVMRFRREDFTYDPETVRDVARLAVPIALQNGFNNFGNIVVQSAVNGFGQSVMAAYTAASRVGTLSLMPVENIGGALSVYAGQNYGAKKMHRIDKGVRSAQHLVYIIGAVTGLLMLLAGQLCCRNGLAAAYVSQTCIRGSIN